MDVCDANTGPIFLACRYPAELLTLMEEWKDTHVPVYDFTPDDEITHRVWIVDEEETIRTIDSLFGRDLIYLYCGMATTEQPPQ